MPVCFLMRGRKGLDIGGGEVRLCKELGEEKPPSDYTVWKKILNKNHIMSTIQVL